MDRINIVICDDEPTQNEYLKSLVLVWAKGGDTLVNITSYNSAEEFLFWYAEDKTVDILLLDIQMGGMDGVQLARIIRSQDERVQLLFVTGIPDFVAEGYEVSALHYLMKPINQDKLFTVLDRAVRNLNRTEQSLFLTINGEMNRIPISEIRYIEAQGHYIVINTTKKTYKTKMSLSEVERSLNNAFFRCQRSFIVGIRYVKKVTKTSIILDDMTQIPLSRGLYDTVNQAIISYFP